MSETLSGEVPLMDLESTPLDMSNVEVEKIDVNRYEFKVPDKETGRKIGLEAAKSLPDFWQKNVKRRLEEPETIADLRLDGNQMSFSEYEEDGEYIVQIYLRYGIEIPEQAARFNNAVSRVLDLKK